MNLLSDILKQNQQIAQNPTPVARTPIQTAYDTLLNAQKNAQDTTKQELGSAIGNSVNGIAKIIASSVIGNPIEKAASTRNLDNFDARQDALVRQWAMEQAKKRNDFVNQAKEQLDMAKADEQQQYERELTSQQLAYKKLQDEIANKLNEDKFDFMKEQAGIENQNKADMLDLQKRKLNAEIESLQNKAPELTEEQKLQNEINKLNAIENAKAKIQANQDLNKAIAGQEAFRQNIEHIKNLSKNAGNVLDRSVGGFASWFTGKENPLTKPNNAMDELVSQIRQAALVASGISGESDDKAQQAKLKDIYDRAGVPMNAKSLTQAQVGSILNNIENIYKQRVAEKQNLLNSFDNKEKEKDKNQFSVSW